MRGLAAIGLLAVIIAAPMLMALSGPVRSFSNPNVACGPRLDGGVNPATDAGFLDGGTEIDQISAESMLSVKLENNSTTPVYLGGSSVQPGTNVVAICTDTATCQSAGISIDTQNGALYCTSETAVTLRALAGGL